MLDKALVEALGEVVKATGQPQSVGQRLLAWLTRMSETEVGRDENNQFLANVRDALVLEDSHAD